MANSEKHKQRSARSYRKKIAEARSFARSTWWKNDGRKKKKSLGERVRKFFKNLFSRQKKG